MFNLNAFIRESSEIPLDKRVLALLAPDFFIAENMRDYLQNASSITIPASKRIHAVYRQRLGGFIAPLHALIAISNIGIEPHRSMPGWFWVHDDTGREMMYWDKQQLFPPKKTSEQFALQKDSYPEWYTAIIARVPHWEEAYIIDVWREPLSPPQEKKEYASLAELILSPA